MDTDGRDALAFTIRDRGRKSAFRPILPAVIPARPCQLRLFDKNPSPTMTKRAVDIDNHFSPSSRDEGSLFTIVFGAAFLAFGAAGWALLHCLGAW